MKMIDELASKGRLPMEIVRETGVNQQTVYEYLERTGQTQYQMDL